MNRHNAVIRYTATIPFAGTTPSSSSPANPTPIPARGEVETIEVELTAGPSTVLTTRLIEGASGHVLFESTGDPFPVSNIIRMQPAIGIHFVGLPIANALEIEVTTDDATNLSTVAVSLDIRGA
jgi:hypothetical protein